MTVGRSILSALGIAALLACVPAHANRITERAKQKQVAEIERAELQKKLTALKHDITQTETAKSHAADALANSEGAISEANRALHELSREQRQAEAKLANLSKDYAQLAKAIGAQQKRLAALLHNQYVAGNEDRIKLLLSDDNPNRINRELQYMGYVSQAQAKLIASLRTNLQSIETNKAETQNTKDELDEIAQEQRQQKKQLEKEKAHRAALLSQLSKKLAAQRQEAGNIVRDEQRLGGLVSRLTTLIEEQRKAEAAAREKRRQEQLARLKAKSEAAASAKEKAAKPSLSNPDAIDDDEPPKLSSRNELVAATNVQDEEFGRVFRSLRGKLRLPVRGELLARYGGKRSGGPVWKGLFIRAAEGAEVQAVAAGQVVIADWLRCFGNLIIIDHGSQYMTIYGNNQAVLKQVGDIVKGGDTIASAGNSGGNEQSGLYFEIRHQGRAFDPLTWMSAAATK
ncbi:MAG TPA: peptidoglycan DD-metalloendopeptidase family protein [Noviherbaspirillum sp.]|nr:peptidoglycan DD-metalloendopeptidase family protein [Noviherbaspirillum sp.]